MSKVLIKNATIVNQNAVKKGHIYIVNDKIEQISFNSEPPEINTKTIKTIDANGKYLIPGVIDIHVHFRDPGLTDKADIYTESKAAAAGGVTSFIDMPNTIPPTLTLKDWHNKNDLAKEKSLINFAFYLGANDDNIAEIEKADTKYVPGIKLFFGSSTGNLALKNNTAIQYLMQQKMLPVVGHCEDDALVKKNLNAVKANHQKKISAVHHPMIRNADACFNSSSNAINMAKQNGTRFHLAHLTTEKELSLLSAGNITNKQITSEVSIHHLWFDDSNYEKLGNKIKVNPAIKSKKDKDALLQALINDKIDLIATDHAPHRLDEKNQDYLNAPSGTPMIQHSLPAMLEMHKEHNIPLEKIVEKMCHNPALAMNIQNRGFIKEGYYADLVLIDLHDPWTVTKHNILYKCGWSAFEGQMFHAKILYTIVNGKIVYNNGHLTEEKGKPLTFKPNAYETS
jgi:dihydroorotase